MTQAKRILVVEDEIKLAELLRDYLLASGYGVTLHHEGNGVVEEVRQNPPDLILLDLMLPGRDGMEICRELRGFSQVPIIMVTARVEEIDRLLGLELGADDYVCKPYSPREVVARVKTVLRRATHALAPGGGAARLLELDEERFAAAVAGRPLELTPVEFRLLSALNRQPGRVYSRTQLLDRLYDDGRIVTERTVDTHVKNLRKKIEALCPERDLIQSVYGVGYKLELG